MAASRRWRGCARAASPSTPRRATSPKPTAPGSGIFKDAGSDASVRELFFDGAIRTWQVVVPDFGTISGPFQVTGVEYAGEHDGEVAAFRPDGGAAGLARLAAELIAVTFGAGQEDGTGEARGAANPPDPQGTRSP